jgi:hypothetical protein
MNPMLRSFSYGLFVLVGVALIGCGGSETTASSSSVDQQDHEARVDDHEHAHPESFAGAVTKVEELLADIKTSMAAGDLAKADGPVHEVGHLLEKLLELASTESLSEADQQQVERAVDSLMDSFAALDERVHGGESKGKSYDEVAAPIEAALSEVRSIGKESTP